MVKLITNWRNKMDNVYEEEYKNHKITIYRDECIESPREWENQATMLCFHKRYNLGDNLKDKRDLEEHVIDLWLEHATMEELKAKILRDCKDKSIKGYREILSYGDNFKNIFEYYYRYENNILGKNSNDLELPKKITWNFLYLYDHSGITISINPFSCRFDSGIVGIIYMIDDSKNPLTYDEQYKIMKQETKTYDDYLTGNCYGFDIHDSNNNCIHSCGGFLGDYDDFCLSEARSVIDNYKTVKQA